MPANRASRPVVARKVRKAAPTAARNLSIGSALRRGAAIDPVVSPAEGGQDLVTDRAGIGGGGIDAVILVQQLDEPTGPHERRVDIGYVENYYIHRDPTEERHSLAADATRDTLAHRAEPAVRIADRDGCEASRCGHDMRGTVANRLIPVNFAYLQNSALQPDDLVHRIGLARLRIDSVERGTRAYEVKVKLGPEEDAGGRGEAGRQVREMPSRSSKALELDVIERVPWFVRTGEMADEGAPWDRIGPAQPFGEPVEVSDGQAEAGHTRVDLQNGRAFPVPRGGALPIGDLPGIVEDRDEAEFDKIVCAAGQQPVQDSDLGRFGQYPAKGDPFIDGGDEKSPASGRGQGGRHQWGA